MPNAGDIINASDFDRPFCRLVQQAAQAIGTSDTALTFGTGSEANDAFNLHNESTNNTRITVDRAGVWMFKGTVFMGGNANITALTATLGINGAVQPARSRSKPASTASTMSQEVMEIFGLSSGDYVELYGVLSLSSGTSQNTNVGGSFASTFEAYYLGPA